MKYGKWLFVFAILAVAIYSPDLIAADNFSAMEESASKSKGATQGTIKSWLWVFALIPIGVASYMTWKMKEYIENKEEQGQYEPKWTKNTKLIGAFAGGLFIMYIVYGIIGIVIFGQASLGDGWDKLFVPFWKDMLT
jgi:heme/copper-type cytochrome/quinol oxidase subunit 2